MGKFGEPLSRDNVYLIANFKNGRPGGEVLATLNTSIRVTCNEQLLPIADRVVACVNACADMADPEAEIAALRANAVTRSPWAQKCYDDVKDTPEFKDAVERLDIEEMLTKEVARLREVEAVAREYISVRYGTGNALRSYGEDYNRREADAAQSLKAALEGRE